MITRLLLSFFIFFSSILFAVANPLEDTLKPLKRPQTTKLAYFLGEERTFSNVTSIATTSNDNFKLLSDSIRRPTAEARKYIKRMRSIIKEARDAKKYLEYLNPRSLVEMPLVQQKKIGNNTYILALDSINVKPDYTEVVAYMIIRNPRDESELHFVGRDIRISN